MAFKEKSKSVKLVKKELTEYTDYKIHFIFLYHAFNASSTFKNRIILYSPWIAIVSNNSFNDIKDILLHTIGHEEAHHNGDYIDFHYQKKFGKLSDDEKRLIKWITEVHHDFYGFIRFNNDYTVTANEIMSQKAKIKDQLKYFKKLSDKDKSKYPTWEQRMKYIKRGKFDRNLIDVIVDDFGGCITSNKLNDLLWQVSKFYGEISLK